MSRPSVFKMGGRWVSTCNAHDEDHRHRAWFSSEDWRDPWTAALVDAIGHYVAYHYVDTSQV